MRPSALWSATVGLRGMRGATVTVVRERRPQGNVTVFLEESIRLEIVVFTLSRRSWRVSSRVRCVRVAGGATDDLGG